MIRPGERGLLPASSTLHASSIRRPCYKTAWSLSQQDGTVALLFPRVPSCMTQRAEPGLSWAASTPHVTLIPRRCYRTEWFLLQEGLTAIAFFWQRRNLDTITADVHRDASKKLMRNQRLQHGCNRWSV